MLPEEMNLMLYDAMISDLDFQLIQNSEDERLHQKQASVETSEIHFKYSQEKEKIRNEMGAQEDKLSEEYMELMQELSEIGDKEDAETAAIETASNDWQSKIEIENQNIETRRDAAKEDREAIQSALDDDIKDSYGYFQN